jgi:hypothetical protein
MVTIAVMATALSLLVVASRLGRVVRELSGAGGNVQELR